MNSAHPDPVYCSSQQHASVQTEASGAEWYKDLQLRPCEYPTIDLRLAGKPVGHLELWFADASGLDSMKIMKQSHPDVSLLSGSKPFKRKHQNIHSTSSACLLCNLVHEAAAGLDVQVPDAQYCPICADTNDGLASPNQRVLYATSSASEVPSATDNAVSTRAANSPTSFFTSMHARNHHVKYRSCKRFAKTNETAAITCTYCSRTFKKPGGLAYHLENQVCTAQKADTRATLLKDAQCPLCAANLSVVDRPPTATEEEAGATVVNKDVLIDEALRQHCYSPDSLNTDDNVNCYMCPSLIAWIRLIGFPLHLTPMGRAYNHLEENQYKDNAQWLRLFPTYWIYANYMIGEPTHSDRHRFPTMHAKMVAVASFIGIERNTGAIRASLLKIGTAASKSLLALFDGLVAGFPNQIQRVDSSENAARHFYLEESDCEVPDEPVPIPAPITFSCDACETQFATQKELIKHDRQCEFRGVKKTLAKLRCSLCHRRINVSLERFLEYAAKHKQKYRNEKRPFKEKLEAMLQKLIDDAIYRHCYNLKIPAVEDINTEEGQEHYRCPTLIQMHQLCTKYTERTWLDLQQAGNSNDRVYRFPLYTWYRRSEYHESSNHPRATRNRIVRAVEYERRTKSMRKGLMSLVAKWKHDQDVTETATAVAVRADESAASSRRKLYSAYAQKKLEDICALLDQLVKIFPEDKNMLFKNIPKYNANYDFDSWKLFRFKLNITQQTEENKVEAEINKEKEVLEKKRNQKEGTDEEETTRHKRFNEVNQKVLEVEQKEQEKEEDKNKEEEEVEKEGGEIKDEKEVEEEQREEAVEEEEEEDEVVLDKDEEEEDDEVVLDKDEEEEDDEVVLDEDKDEEEEEDEVVLDKDEEEEDDEVVLDEDKDEEEEDEAVVLDQDEEEEDDEVVLDEDKDEEEEDDEVVLDEDDEEEMEQEEEELELELENAEENEEGIEDKEEEAEHEKTEDQEEEVGGEDEDDEEEEKEQEQEEVVSELDEVAAERDNAEEGMVEDQACQDVGEEQ